MRIRSLVKKESNRVQTKCLKKSYLYVLNYRGRRDGFRVMYHAYLVKGVVKKLANDVWWKEIDAGKWIEKNIKDGWKGVVYPVWMRSETCDCKEVQKWLAIARYFRLRAEGLGMNELEGDKVVEEVGLKYRD